MSIVLRIGAVKSNSFGADHAASGQDANNSELVIYTFFYISKLFIIIIFNILFIAF